MNRIVFLLNKLGLFSISSDPLLSRLAGAHQIYSLLLSDLCLKELSSKDADLLCTAAGDERYLSSILGESDPEKLRGQLEHLSSDSQVLCCFLGGFERRLKAEITVLSEIPSGLIAEGANYKNISDILVKKLAVFASGRVILKTKNETRKICAFMYAKDFLSQLTVNESAFVSDVREECSKIINCVRFTNTADQIKIHRSFSPEALGLYMSLLEYEALQQRRRVDPQGIFCVLKEKLRASRRRQDSQIAISTEYFTNLLRSMGIVVSNMDPAAYDPQILYLHILKNRLFEKLSDSEQKAVLKAGYVLCNYKVLLEKYGDLSILTNEERGIARALALESSCSSIPQ